MKSQKPRSSCERKAVSVTQARNGGGAGVASTMRTVVCVVMRVLLSARHQHDTRWGRARSTGESRLLFPPADLEHADRVLEAAQGVLAAVREQEPLARAQLSHGHRRQDLAALRLRRYPGRQDDRGAEEG